jgi:c(7)-type cytochrome triheme protein
MGDCTGCHFDKASDAGKVPVVAPRGPNQYATTGAFSHKAHAREARVGTKGKECLTCHSNIASAPNDTTIPMPAMKDCYQSCHNGKQAFDATGATCTRCHKGGRK